MRADIFVQKNRTTDNVPDFYMSNKKCSLIYQRLEIVYKFRALELKSYTCHLLVPSVRDVQARSFTERSVFCFLVPKDCSKFCDG